MSRSCIADPKMEMLLLLVIISFLLVATISVSSASEMVYTVNSYGHNTPSKQASTVTMMRGSDLSIVKSVAVGYDAHYMAASPDGSSLWVTNRGSNSIDVIDPVSLKILKNISSKDIATPVGIAFTPDGKSVYVTLESAGKVAIFDAHTYAYLSSIDVGGNPAFIVFTPNGSKEYVVDFQNAIVSVIRTADNYVSNLPMRGQKLQEAVISPDGAYVYVINRDKNQIEIIRTKDDEVLIPIPITGIYPQGISISHDGAYLFIGLQQKDSDKAFVNMLQLADNTVISSFPIPGISAVTGKAMSITIRPDGSRIFVSDPAHNICYALDVDGKNLTRAAARALGGQSELAPASIWVAVIENPISSQPSQTNANSSQPSGEKSGNAAPGFSSFVAIAALLLLSRWFWHRG